MPASLLPFFLMFQRAPIPFSRCIARVFTIRFSPCAPCRTFASLCPDRCAALPFFFSLLFVLSFDLPLLGCLTDASQPWFAICIRRRRFWRRLRTLWRRCHMSGVTRCYFSRWRFYCLLSLSMKEPKIPPMSSTSYWPFPPHSSFEQGLSHLFNLLHSATVNFGPFAMSIKSMFLSVTHSSISVPGIDPSSPSVWEFPSTSVLARTGPRRGKQHNSATHFHCSDRFICSQLSHLDILSSVSCSPIAFRTLSYLQSPLSMAPPHSS